ncbi:hypothetical protein F5Y08DRAFT_353828 [Xylaria arbuscula]|nr:hypothetical protein F5Y08DRAFT_353828 [Xylaria arbuscula]
MPARKNAGVHPRGGGPETTNVINTKRRSQVSQTPQTASTRRSKRLETKRTLDEAAKLLATTQASPEGRALSRPNQYQNDTESQLYAKLSTWLDEVSVGVSEDLAAFGSGQSDSDEENDDGIMATPCQCSLLSTPTSEAPSTIIAVPPKSRAKKPDLESFRTRRVEVKTPREDESTIEFKKYLVEKRIKIPFEKTEDLLESFKIFERKAEAAGIDDDSWDAIEELCKGINRWKAKMRLATITNEDFNDDLEHCRFPSNETVFQRTVMMSIIDRSHLKNVFDFNCEGQWFLDQGHSLPSTNGRGDVIIDPKPDLAIFFRFDSLLGTDPFEASQPIPPELKPCMNPDKYTQRCFPFIFIEAKKGFEDIQPAALANMHSASQALFNIYKWMNRANEGKAFFEDVRLFSIAINAKELIARVHRARSIAKDNDVGLAFSYDDLYPEEKVRYSRDEVCTLVHNILSEYAEKKLLGILRKTVQRVLDTHVQSLKRKNDADLLGRPSKLVASAHSGALAPDPLLPNASTSFGMSQVDIHDG